MSTFRIVMIGNAFVGKTALVSRFIHKTVQKNYDQTIGASFHTYCSKIDGHAVSFQIWDTAGTEKYRSLAPVYYRNASAAILTFDMTDKASFEDLPNWIEVFRNSSNPDSMIFIVANKNDLENSIVVSEETGRRWAEENEFSFFSTSAITGSNVELLFDTVTKEIVKNNSVAFEENNQTLKDSQTNCC